jgi:hypothetical protein
MVTSERFAQVVCAEGVASSTAEVCDNRPLVARCAQLGLALSKPNGRKHLRCSDFSSRDAATLCAGRIRQLHVFWRRIICRERTTVSAERLSRTSPLPLGEGLGVRARLPPLAHVRRWGGRCAATPGRAFLPSHLSGEGLGQGRAAAQSATGVASSKQTPNCQRTRRRWRASHPTTLAGPISSEFLQPPAKTAKVVKAGTLIYADFR